MSHKLLLLFLAALVAAALAAPVEIESELNPMEDKDEPEKLEELTGDSIEDGAQSSVITRRCQAREKVCTKQGCKDRSYWTQCEYTRFRCKPVRQNVCTPVRHCKQVCRNINGRRGRRRVCQNVCGYKKQCRWVNRWNWCLKIRRYRCRRRRNVCRQQRRCVKTCKPHCSKVCRMVKQCLPRPYYWALCTSRGKGCRLQRLCWNYRRCTSQTCKPRCSNVCRIVQKSCVPGPYYWTWCKYAKAKG